jgi:hypothetical protein
LNLDKFIYTFSTKKDTVPVYSSIYTVFTSVFRFYVQGGND